jgi:phospholipid transport system substrate-binding protein
MLISCARRACLAFAFALLFTLAPPSHPATAAGEASVLITDLSKKALAIVSEKPLTLAERQKRLAALVLDGFDLPRIARFVLGRYWQMASDAEREEFTRVYSDYLVHTYAARTDDYTGDSFHVLSERAESETTTLVTAEVTRPGTVDPVKVIWRVVKTPNGYKIADVSVAGVSLAITQREEFSAIVQRSGGNVADLIKQLRTKTNAVTAAQ